MSEATPLEGVVLTVSALNGLEFAAARRDGRPMSTTDLLLGLVTADDDGSWADVQLKANYVEPEDAERHLDPDSQPAGSWHNVPLTATATASLQAAVRIAADYHLVPLPPGALALGLLLDPKTGACRALLEGSDCSHDQLLDMVQADVLGVDLEGLHPAAVTGQRGPALAGRLARIMRSAQPPASVREHDWITDAPGAMRVLADSLDATGADKPLRDLLGSMILEADRIKALERQLRDRPDVPADAVYESARRRFGLSQPDPCSLIVSVALSGSKRVGEALRRMGLTSNEVAAQISEYRLRSGIGGSDDRVSSQTIRFTILNALVGALTSLLVIRASFGAGGHWWRLFFLPLVWTGYPQFGPAGSAAVAVVMAVFVSPLVGAVHLIGILADVAQARAERRTMLARTGVYLSMAELRRVTQRFLNSRARLMRSLLQAQKANLLALRDGREDPYS